MSESRMRSVDRAWLRMDDPANLMIVNTLLVLAEPLARARLQGLVDERLAWIRRMRLRVAPGRLWHRWVEREVEVEAHVRESVLAEPGDDAALRALIGELVSRPLDPRRPLWELRVIQNYRGRTAVLARVHHAVGDGLALLLVLLSLTDLEREREHFENPLRALFSSRGEDPRSVEGARRFIREVMPTGMKLMLHHDHLGDQADAAERSLITTAARSLKLGAAVARDLAALVIRRPDSPSVFRGPLVVAKRVAWSRPIALAELRALRRPLDGTVNDIILAAMTGGLRRYLLARGGAPRDVELRAAVPVNLRRLPDLAKLGNRFGLVFLTLPVGIAEPRARLAEIHRRMDALKRSVEPLVTWGILELMGSAPKLVERLILDYFAKRVSFVMTNVPGPERPLYLAGREIESLMFWVPQSGRVGLGVSMFSYAGTLRLGVACDARLVPDPEGLIAGFHGELDELLELGRG